MKNSYLSHILFNRVEALAVCLSDFCGTFIRVNKFFLNFDKLCDSKLYYYASLVQSL